VIRENLSRVRERIHSACLNAGRNPQEITVVAISKGRVPGQIEEVIAEGIHNIGESKVQEALSKYNALRAPQGVMWHMVGRLQTNKLKDAVGIFDLIHSLDSLRLASEINRQAQRLGKVQDVLVEIKTSPEEAKSGLGPDEAPEAIKQMAELKNINIQGLMTIAPLVDNSEKTRPYFRMLKELKDKINQLTTRKLTILSMGMTDDFQIAIEEGATMVRLGRAIFEGQDKCSVLE
jgi:pyridoxal phosphate enzyme (YggS family)